MKNLTIVFLVILGSVFSSPLWAEDYGAVITITTQNEISYTQLFSNEASSSETIKTHIRVKNGKEFIINLPLNANVSNLWGGVLINSQQIKVSSAGSLRFLYNKDGVHSYVLAHVNYFGVLQYPGASGPQVTDNQTITIASDADLEKELGFFGNFGPGVMYFFWEKDLDNSGNWSFFSDETQNIKVMKMSTILEQGNGNNTFRIRITTSDDTANVGNGQLLGVKRVTITIKDERPTVIAPTITTNELTSAQQNQAYAQQLVATGTAPITWSLVSGQLPAGLSLNGSGLISGTPTVAGNFTFTVKASNSAGADEKQFTLEVTAEVIPLVITTTSLPKAQQYQAYSQQLTATGTAPIIWIVVSGSLPAGLSLTTEGLFYGTPMVSGSFTFTVEASNSAGSDTKQLILVVAAQVIAPTITTTELTSAQQNQAYAQQLVATGTAPITWSLVSGQLPAGLSLNGSGLISGTPTVSGSFTFTVKASNSAGDNQKQLTLVVAAQVIAPPTNFILQKGYQRDAIISWTARGNETEWEVRWGEQTITVTEPKATLRKLEPNTETTVKICAKVGDQLSEALIGNFKTENFTETWRKIPHLYDLKTEVTADKATIKVAKGTILPLFWEDMEQLPTSMTFNLSPTTSTTENTEKIFTPLSDTINFGTSGTFILTIRFEGIEFTELTYIIEVQ